MPAVPRKLRLGRDNLITFPPARVLVEEIAGLAEELEPEP